MTHPVRSIGVHINGLIVLVGLALPSVVRGQSADDAKKAAAYFALSVTPIGALPPFVTRSMAGGSTTSGSSTATSTPLHPQIAFRYGRGTIGENPDNTHLNSLAATGMVAAGEAATLNATIGMFDPDCSDEDCDAKWMFGFGADLALGSAQIGSEADSPRLTMGLNGEFGYTKPADDISALSLSAGLPIALVARSGSMRVVPFLTPAIGYGRTRLETGEPVQGAVRFLLGGGLSLLNISSAVSVNVGFQKIFFSLEEFGTSISSKTLFGASVTLGN